MRVAMVMLNASVSSIDSHLPVVAMLQSSSIATNLLNAYKVDFQ